MRMGPEERDRVLVAPAQLRVGVIRPDRDQHIQEHRHRSGYEDEGDDDPGRFDEFLLGSAPSTLRDSYWRQGISDGEGAGRTRGTLSYCYGPRPANAGIAWA